MAGVLRYEWRRISTVRSTWIMAGAAVLVTVGIGLILILLLNAEQNAAREAGELITPLDLTAVVVGMIVFNPVVWVLMATIAAQSFGQEFRHGTLRLTLTAFPTRPPVFIAKIVICLVVITVALAASLIVGLILVGLAGGSAIGFEEPITSAFGLIARGWILIVGIALMAIAITVVTRLIALGIVIPLMLFGVEFIFVPIVGQFIGWLPNVLPLHAGLEFVGGDSMIASGAIFACWVVVPLIAAFTLFQARDA